MNQTTQDHWNKIYASQPVRQLGWYEETPGPCLRLLAKCDLAPDDPILDVGAGATTFIDCLIEQGFKNISAIDISAVGLDQLKERLGRKADRVTWIIDDVTQPERLLRLHDVALWHDRALLHFLIEEDQRQAYLATLRHTVRPGGYVLIAVFALSGATKCSGLDVRRYDQHQLAEFLGIEFELIETFDYTYQMPSGDLRPYLYALFQRVL